MMLKKLKINFKTSILLALTVFALSCSEPSAGHRNHAETASQNQKAETTSANAATADSQNHNDPHMRMTHLREPRPEDEARAREIADRARQAIEKYQDYKVALRDGFEILLPEVPQKMYHFNKLANYMEAESRFNPERPTSLLYEKTGDGAGYRLIGVMYTAPAGMPEDELNERVPLSVTQWHEHVNICLPRGSDTFKGLIGQGDKFGLEGSITTKEECAAAGGQFLPRLLGWMVHLYPYEQTVKEMWAVERQMNTGGGTSHSH
ncbi:MAG: hypothetical protein M3384_17700 [Acidobacteriota bacterium]|nr:hypothetical protein [Acidobacteriota bacterium]